MKNNNWGKEQNKEEMIALLAQAAKIRLASMKDLKVMIRAEEFELERLNQKNNESQELHKEKERLQKSLEERYCELQKLSEAAYSVSDEMYGLAIIGRYFGNMSDEKIAEEICCDVTTVRRNRKKLLYQVASVLYELGA